MQSCKTRILVYQCIYVYPQWAAGHAVFWDSVCPEEEDDHFRQWSVGVWSHWFYIHSIHHYIRLHICVYTWFYDDFWVWTRIAFAMLCLWSMVTGLRATGGAWCAYPERACSRWCLRASSLALKQSLHWPLVKPQSIIKIEGHPPMCATWTLYQ